MPNFSLRVWFARNGAWLPPLLIFLLAFLVYLPTLSADFLDWDDGVYIFDNPHLRGIDAQYLRWAFTTTYYRNWIPLVWVSFGLDYTLWGLNPLGYHLSNVLLHSVNSALVFVLARVLFARKLSEAAAAAFTAGIVGVFFAVHPLHVESVAWVTERKDVLYACFFLGALLAYVRWAGERQRRDWRLYGLSLLLFLCAIMSKPMAVTLPAVLLILDWYPLGRFRSRTDVFPVAVAEKVPFYLLGALGAFVAVKAFATSETLLPGAQVMADTLYPLKIRLVTALHALGQYSEDAFLPIGLVPYYPFVKASGWLDVRQLRPALVVLLITALAVLLRKKAPVVPASWLFFLVTIFPSLGVAGTYGVTSIADRFMYLPLLGFLVAVAAAAAPGYQRGSAGTRRALLVLACAAAAALGLITVRQSGVWRDSLHLWREVAAHNPEDHLVLKNLGMAQFHAGEYESSIGSFSRSIERYRLRPANYFYRGQAYAKLGRFQEALQDLNSALEIEQGYRMIRTAQAVGKNLVLYHQKKAEVLEAMGDPEAAAQEIGLARALGEPAGGGGR